MKQTLALPISVAVLTALGTFLMGLGERDLTLPLVAIVVGVLSVFFTDVKKWFRLHAAVANLSGLAAVMMALQGAREMSGQLWLLSIAHLLAYLQFILLFQEKTLRHYWLLLTLSLFQVAVAAAINLEVWFGVLLGLYLFNGLICLTLVFLYAQRQRQARLEKHTRLETQARGAADVEAGAAAEGSPRRSHLRDGFQREAHDDRVSWGLLQRLAGTTVVALLVAAVVFVLIPRLASNRPNGANWANPLGGAQRLVGFSGQVNLNDLGTALESSEPVMKVWLTDDETGEPLELANRLRLRGSLLDRYAEGTWQRNSDLGDNLPPLRQPPPVENTTPLVRQFVELAPLDNPVLFGVYPWATDQPRADVLQQSSQRTEQRSSLLLARPQVLTSTRFQYQLLTWNVRNKMLRDEFPHYLVQEGPIGDRRVWLQPSTLNPDEYAALTELPQQSDGTPALPVLEAKALEVVTRLPISDEGFVADPRQTPTAAARSRQRYLLEQYEQLPPDLVRRYVRMIEGHFQTSGQYNYSLRVKVGDPTLDPLEDFLLNRKAGHCEYFASAAALMLRRHGIPTRVVVGFVDGEFNPLGGFYQVRQYHAHSWLECYLPGGRWLQIDPTPSQQQRIREEVEPGFSQWRQMTDYLQSLWAGYVLGLNPEQQQRHVYRPLTLAARQAWQSVANNNAWQSLWANFRALWAFDGVQNTLRAWLSVTGILTFLLVWNLIYFGVRSLRFCYRMARDWLTTGNWQREDAELELDLFARLEMMLAHHHIFRDRGQTPREFATAAEGPISRRVEIVGRSGDLVIVPQQIVAAYYRARFGQRGWDLSQKPLLENSLWQLQQALEAAAEAEQDQVAAAAGRATAAEAAAQK